MAYLLTGTSIVCAHAKTKYFQPATPTNQQLRCRVSWKSVCQATSTSYLSMMNKFHTCHFIVHDADDWADHKLSSSSSAAHHHLTVNFLSYTCTFRVATFSRTYHNVGTSQRIVETQTAFATLCKDSSCYTYTFLQSSNFESEACPYLSGLQTSHVRQDVTSA